MISKNRFPQLSKAYCYFKKNNADFERERKYDPKYGCRLNPDTNFTGPCLDGSCCPDGSESDCFGD